MNNSIAGVWVRASERLPDVDDGVYITIDKDGEAKKMGYKKSSHTKWHYLNGKYLTENVVMHGHIVLWLDETQPIPVNQDEVANAELMKDPFIQKHLARIWELTKDSKIELYIKPMFGGLSAASIKYFLQTGTVNGDFYLALHKMMDGCKNWQSNQQPIPVQEGLREILMHNPYPANIFPVLSVHEMQDINKLLLSEMNISLDRLSAQIWRTLLDGLRNQVKESDRDKEEKGELNSL